MARGSGLRRGIVGGLDHVQMDAVAEDISRPAEHDHPDGAALSVPVGGEQPAALGGAHGAAWEGELQVADAAGLAVGDLLVRVPARRHRQWRADLRHTGGCFAERQRRRQLDGERPAEGRAAAQLRDPDRAVHGSPADRAAPARHNRPRLTAQVIFLVPAEQEVLGPADHVEDTGPSPSASSTDTS
jgi:hypothetical protein